MATEITLIRLPDDSLEGLLTWISILAIAAVVLIPVYELVRRNPKFAHVYYARFYSAPEASFPIPKALFGALKPLYKTSDAELQNRLGLDALQFIRYISMCFKILAVLSVLLFGILIPVNYYAGSASSVDFNVTDSDTVIKSTTEVLSLFSISNVADASSVLWVHLLFAFFVTAFVLKTLYSQYQLYAESAIESLSRNHHSASEDYEKRTVLFKNIKGDLACKKGLREWLESMQIGPVEIICMNTTGGYDLYNLLNNHEKIMRQLETAYMQWTANIYRYLEKQPFIQLNSTIKIQLHHSKPGHDIEDKSWNAIKRLRPFSIRPSKTGVVKTDDSIQVLTLMENDLVEALLLERSRAEASDYESNVPSAKTFSGPRTVSAFVTFESLKSSIMAQQLLLHSEMGSDMLKIQKAPRHSQVIWTNLTLPLNESLLRYYLVSIVAIGFSLLWAIPSSFISSLTDLPKLAINPEFTGYVEYISLHPGMAFFVANIGPPLLIQAITSFFPFVFQCF